METMFAEPKPEQLWPRSHDSTTHYPPTWLRTGQPEGPETSWMSRAAINKKLQEMEGGALQEKAGHTPPRQEARHENNERRGSPDRREESNSRSRTHREEQRRERDDERDREPPPRDGNSDDVRCARWKRCNHCGRLNPEERTRCRYCDRDPYSRSQSAGQPDRRDDDNRHERRDSDNHRRRRDDDERRDRGDDDERRDRRDNDRRRAVSSPPRSRRESPN